jgi:ATP-dependent Clp protease ATP-binding subunit ClpC
MKVRIMGELKKVFRPEFLNRIDEVIVFHKLTKEEITAIVELLLKRIRESLAERELSLNLSDSAADFLVEKGWDPAMGARPLRRAIQRYIEDPLADEVLSQSMPPGSTIEVDKADKPAEGEDERELEISVVKGKERTREAVGVGAKGGPLEEGGSEEPEQPSGEGAPDLPDEPEVLPDVPDAPPAEEQ